MKPTLAPRQADLALLDEFLGAPDFWVQRTEEGRSIATKIVESSNGLVILCGKALCGKTELIARWVQPILAEKYEVYLSRQVSAPLVLETKAGGSIGFWEALSAGSVVVVDDFEDYFMLEEKDRGQFLTELTDWLRTRRKGVLVLVLREEFLGRIVTLSASVPGMLDNVHEIHSISFEDAAGPMERVMKQYDVPLEPEVIRTVLKDASGLGPTSSLNPRIIAILGFEFYRTKAYTQGQPYTLQDFQAAGGVAGLLDSHLVFVLETLPTKTETRMAAAILEEIALGSAKPKDLENIAHQFDVSVDLFARTMGWLEAERALVRGNHSGKCELVIPQFTPVLRARVDRHERSNDELRKNLRDTLRHADNLLLPENIFLKIHSDRSKFRTSDAEAQLLLRCALVYEEDGSGAAPYWLRRVGNEDLYVEALFNALFDSHAAVRLRAAGLLAGNSGRPEVRNQLHLLGLRDPSPEVRRQAIASLESTKDEQLRVSLMREIDDRTSPHRAEAIEALRIFRDSETAARLEKIVSSTDSGDGPQIRKKAIQVLGLLNTAEAIDTLLRIALRDHDEEDRREAAATLKLVEDESMLRQVLDRMRDSRMVRETQQALRSMAARKPIILPAIAAAAVTALDLVFPGALLISLKRFRTGLVCMGVSAIGVTLMLTSEGSTNSIIAGFVGWLGGMLAGQAFAARIVLKERRDNRLGQTGYRRSLAFILFCESTVTGLLYNHGLLHMVSRRVSRGITLLAFQLLGIFLFASLVFLSDILAAFSKISPFFSFLDISLRWTSVFIFLGSWAYDVLRVGYDTLLFGSAKEARQRLGSLDRELISNPVAFNIVLQELNRGNKRISRRAEKSLLRVLPQVEPALRALLPSADVPTTRKVLGLLTKRPSEPTLHLIRAAFPKLGITARIQYFRVACRLPFVMWPASVLLLSVLIISSLSVFVVAGYKFYVNQPDQIAAVFKSSSSNEERRSAVEKLLVIASEFSGTRSSEASTELAELLKDESMDDRLRVQIVEGIVKTANTDARKENAVMTLAAVIDRNPSQIPDLMSASLRGLGSLSTLSAIAKLRHFVESSSDSRFAEVGLGALGDIATSDEAPEEASVRAFIVLGEMRKNKRLPDDLQDKLQRQVARIDDARKVKYSLHDAAQKADDDLNEGRYEAAIATAQLALESQPGGEDAAHLRLVASRAHFELGKVVESKDNLLGALPQLADQDIDSAVDLALTLSVEFHDVRNQPEDCYRILEALGRLDTRLKGRRPLVLANLVEASLTVGRYDDAETAARKVLEKESEDLGSQNKMNVQCLVYLTLLFQGRYPESEAALRQLRGLRNSMRKDFQNSWQWDGTKSYIGSSSLPAQYKSKAFEALELVK